MFKRVFKIFLTVSCLLTVFVMSPSAVVRADTDYSLVFNASYYDAAYPDVHAAFNGNADALLYHFINYGMAEGRRASANFDVHIYRANYSDLEAAFGSDFKSYYLHYINYGHAESRVADHFLRDDALSVEHTTGKEINYFTPVGNDADASTLVSAGDSAGNITHDGIITSFTVNPRNTVNHGGGTGYGLRDYVRSLSGKDLMKSFIDTQSRQTFIGNIVIFTFDVWVDATGDGLSADDYFYPAGTEIPVGTTRTFYTTAATATGSYNAGYASIAVNSPADKVFSYSAGNIRVNNTSITGSKLNGKTQYQAYSTKQYNVRSAILGARVVYADGFYSDSLPRSNVTLKRGYTASVEIDTVGSFNASGYIELVPHFSWVDESFANERTDVKLFYDTYIDGVKTQLVQIGGSIDLANRKSIRADDDRLGISARVYNLRSSLKSISAGSTVSTYAYGKASTGECFYQAVDKGRLPRSSVPADTFATRIEKGLQKWYVLYSLPSDVMLLRGDSRYYNMEANARLADYIYGQNGFIKEGYVKVTFDIVAHDDTGAVISKAAAGNVVAIYYDLDKRVGDDMVIKGIYNY